MHIKRGWSDIGYHYLIGLEGEIGLGRKESTIPAAVFGYNRGMIAIAYVGGMGPDGKPKDTRTVKQKEASASWSSCWPSSTGSRRRPFGATGTGTTRTRLGTAMWATSMMEEDVPVLRGQ
jgi:N-acetylmuramoyl-L-alanine amidase